MKKPEATTDVLNKIACFTLTSVHFIQDILYQNGRALIEISSANAP